LSVEFISTTKAVTVINRYELLTSHFLTQSFFLLSRYLFVLGMREYYLRTGWHWLMWCTKLRSLVPSFIHKVREVHYCRMVTWSPCVIFLTYLNVLKISQSGWTQRKSQSVNFLHILHFICWWPVIYYSL